MGFQTALLLTTPIDLCDNLLEGGASGNLITELILHVSEKAFLRGVVPAIAFTRHTLAQPNVLYDLDELDTCVMASLIRVIPNSA